jgi:vacuolar protein sorting-associated protein 53
LLREQTNSEIDGGRKELEIAKSSLTSLIQDIKDIKEKAQHAEQTVQYITKDIKSLDCAKKNLINSVTILKRLQMMSSAVDQLHTILSKRQYSEMAKLVSNSLV